MTSRAITLLFVTAACGGEDSRAIDGEGNYRPATGRWVLDIATACESEPVRVEVDIWYEPLGSGAGKVIELEYTGAAACDVPLMDDTSAVLVCNDDFAIEGEPSIGMRLVDDGAEYTSYVTLYWDIDGEDCRDESATATVVERVRL